MYSPRSIAEGWDDSPMLSCCAREETGRGGGGEATRPPRKKFTRRSLRSLIRLAENVVTTAARRADFPDPGHDRLRVSGPSNLRQLRARLAPGIRRCHELVPPGPQCSGTAEPSPMPR